MGLRMGWKPRTVTLGATLAAFALIALNGAAAAAFDPYTSRTLGYDYSYIQCGTPAPTTSFGVVGVNAGYPFTYYNSCLATEFAAAAKTGNAALYVAATIRSAAARRRLKPPTGLAALPRSRPGCASACLVYSRCWPRAARSCRAR